MSEPNYLQPIPSFDLSTGLTMRSPASTFRSLSTKLLLLTCAWLLFAMTSIGYTLVLSWKLEGGAAAINDTGSLRMRSYRVALLVSEGTSLATLKQEEQQFNETLARLIQGDPARPLFLPNTDEVRQHVHAIERVWQTEMMPRLEQAIQYSGPETARTHPDISAFANQINDLVKLIEDDNAQNTTMLRFFQMALIAMAVIGSMTMMFLLFLLIIRPLNTLGEAIARLRDGELGTRVNVNGNDEFAFLSAGFNQMADRLQDLYATLEHKVEEKTRSVEEKNRHLTALYGMTTFLHETYEIDAMCEGFIERLMDLTDADAGSVRLLDTKRRRLELIAQQGLPPDLLASESCASLSRDCHCSHATQQADAVIYRFDARLSPEERKHCHRAGFSEISVSHIKYNQNNIGIFTLYFREKSAFPPKNPFLLETLGSHLGIAIENRRLAARDQQFAVSEERNLMAQGLHDSIAQSLSFLNLQVQMLENALANQQPQEAQENLGFIRNGIQECYEDVRELLLNFRTRISKENFTDAIRTLLTRFEQQSGVSTQLTLEGNGLPLDPQQELQVIFILQEALSNVRKHAHAQQVSIDIRNHDDFEMRICDDGCGFDQHYVHHGKPQHVGLSIMQERATRIHSSIHIEPRENGGTEVYLVLPQNKRQAT